MKTLFGLPKKIVFCKKTLVSNQRPVSKVEFLNSKTTKSKGVHIDKNRISDPWKYSRIKKKIDYKIRENQLLKLLSKYRSNSKNYDCIVPGSGGKDSCFASHILKYKYGMNPLTVTWPPIFYTNYGKENFKNWLKIGKFENISAKRNFDQTKLLTKLAIENLMHPFQAFIIGQKLYPIKVALKLKVPLIFYGENEAEHGNPLKDTLSSLRNTSFFSAKKLSDIRLGGLTLNELYKDYKLTTKDLEDYIPPENNELNEAKINVQYLGYYVKWIHQEAYYYSVENCGFRPRPFRTQGTYTKHISIDDKIDDLHYYTYFIKFGIGRATSDVSQEIRNDHLTIEEGKKLIKKYDGEFPDIYFNDIMRELKLKKSFFFKKLDNFRSPHLWFKKGKKWKLRHTVNMDGYND